MIVLVAFPIENMITNFSTPEIAFKYIMGNDRVVQIVDGEQSSFVIGEKQDSYIYLILPKSDDGWEIDYGLNTKMIMHKFVDNLVIHVYQYKNSSEFYLTILNIDGGYMDVSDSIGTEFVKIEKTNDSINKTFVTYYAYIPNFNSQYQITVNNTIVELNTNQ